MQRDNGASHTRVHVEHGSEQSRVVDHDVVGEQHGERFVSDVMPRNRHRVSETEWVALADVVDVGEVRCELHFLQQLVLPRCLEEVLEFEVAVKVVFDCTLRPAGDDHDVGEARTDSFLDDVLDRGPVDDRHHLFG